MKQFKGPIVTVLALVLAVGIWSRDIPVADADNPSAYLNVREGTTPMLLSKTGKALILGSQSTDGVIFRINGSTVATANSEGLLFGSAVQPQFPAASVITPSTSVPTPGTGNTLSNPATIVAAGAPTAAYVVLPLATASVGKTYKVYNQGSNPVAVVPQTGVINVSGALTPFSCPTLKECTCRGLTTAAFGCSVSG